MDTNDPLVEGLKKFFDNVVQTIAAVTAFLESLEKVQEKYDRETQLALTTWENEGGAYVGSRY